MLGFSLEELRVCNMRVLIHLSVYNFNGTVYQVVAKIYPLRTVYLLAAGNRLPDSSTATHDY